MQNLFHIQKQNIYKNCSRQMKVEVDFSLSSLEKILKISSDLAEIRKEL